MSEFLLSLWLTLIAITATTGLLRTEWDRARCAYLTFEAVHARLTGAAITPGMLLHVQIEAGSEQVRGQGTCGQAHEQVQLPWLEEAEGSE